MRKLEVLSGLALIAFVLVSIGAITITAQAASSIPTWAKTYHVTGAAETVNSLQQTTDGGFIAAGDLGTFTGCPARGSQNQAWVFKLDPMGNIVWQRTYLRSASVDSIQQTSDGGFILAGRGTPACQICFSPPTGIWVVKLTALGNVTWQQVYSIGIANFAS